MKYCVIFILIFLDLCFIHGLGITQDTLWTKRYGGSGSEGINDIEVTDNDHFILAGFWEGIGAYFLKTNSLGKIIWSSTFVSGISKITPNSLHNNAYMAVGTNLSDISLVCVGDNGDSLWSRTYGDSLNEYGVDIDATDDKGYILAGNRRVFYQPDDMDWFIVRIDSIGDTLWTRTYGWSDYDVVRSIESTTDDGYAIAGFSYLNEEGRGYLVKADSLGSIIWYHLEYDGLDKDYRSVKQTTDGGYVVAGSTEAWDWFLIEKFYLVKYDSLGNKEWQKEYGEFPYLKVASEVLQTVDGGYMMIGKAHEWYGNGDNSAFIVRTDSGGEMLWELILPIDGINSFLRTGAVLSDNEYIVAGVFDHDMWLLKLREPSYCCEVDMYPDDDPVVVQPGGS
ncbi:MAG: hypothetical protein GF315_06320, partial [candidate division Zixibacteria bacterium]|nr:hypothetical protein [candidate division Zixibacteria bacterium]